MLRAYYVPGTCDTRVGQTVELCSHAVLNVVGETVVAFPTNSSKRSERKVQGSLKEFSLGTRSDLEGQGRQWSQQRGKGRWASVKWSLERMFLSEAAALEVVGGAMGGVKIRETGRGQSSKTLDSTLPGVIYLPYAAFFQRVFILTLGDRVIMHFLNEGTIAQIG